MDKKKLKNIELKYLQFGETKSIRTFPAKVYLPLSKLSIYDELKLSSGKLDLAEFLLGSIFTYTSQKTIPPLRFQLNTLVPLPYSIIKDDQDKTSIVWGDLPYNLITQSGYIALSISLESIYDKLKGWIEETLCQIGTLFTEIDNQYNLNDKISEQLKCKSKKNFHGTNNFFIMDFIDPKLILKVFVQEFFPRWSLQPTKNNEIDGSTKRNIHNIIKERLSIIRNLRVTIPIDSSLVNQFQINGMDNMEKLYDSNSAIIKYRGINTFRLEQLYEKILLRIRNIINAKQCSSQDSLIYFGAMLLGYLDFANDITRKKISSNTLSKDVFVTYNFKGLSDALTIGILELGIHAISHLMLKFASFKLKISPKSLSEMIVISSTPVSINYGYYNSYFGIIDGYLFRFQHGHPFASIIIILKQPYSELKVKTAIGCNDENCNDALQDFLEFCYKIIGNDLSTDNCYSRWIKMRPPAIASLNLLSSALTNTPICRKRLSLGELIIKILDKLGSLHGFKNKQLNNPTRMYNLFYLPRSSARRYIYKNILSELLAEDYKITEKDYEDCIKEVRKAISSYVNQLYEAALPDCFDGCYNCVLSEECGTPNPIIKEWLTSKFSAKLILQEIKNSMKSK